MTFFSAFWVSFGSTLALMAVVAAWLFRTSGASLWLKLVIPAILVALACYTPGAINSMLGLPVTTTIGGLPDKAQLLQFLPIDQERRVDLWLLAGPVPRVYEVPLDAQLKATLREAQGDLAEGRPAMLSRHHKSKTGARGEEGKSEASLGDPFGIGNDDSDYVVDPDALTTLPPKGLNQ